MLTTKVPAAKMGKDEAITTILCVLYPLMVRADIAGEMARVQQEALANLAERYAGVEDRLGEKSARAAVRRLIGIESRAGQLQAAVEAVKSLRFI